MSASFLRRVFPILLVACALPPAPVTVARPIAPSIAPAARGTLLGGCTIEGAGERPRPRRSQTDEDIPFAVFATADAREAVLVVADPEHAHVVWSHFPAPATGALAHRAQIELHGQGIRYRGWAELYGRTFTATRRMEAEHGHLWARVGAPIDIVSANDAGVLFAEVATPFAAPSRIVVEGSCADVRYQPDPPPPRRPHTPRAPATNRKVVHLFMTADAGRPFTTIDAASRTLALDVLERSGERVRVVFDANDVGFDAWAPSAEVDDQAGADATKPTAPAASRARVPALAERARVSADAPIYAGDPLERLDGAALEAGATVEWDPGSEVLVDGHALVAFGLASGLVAAKEDRMWTRKDALAR